MSHLHKISTSYKLQRYKIHNYFEVLTNTTCAVYPLAYEKHEPEFRAIFSLFYKQLH